MSENESSPLNLGLGRTSVSIFTASAHKQSYQTIKRAEPKKLTEKQKYDKRMQVKIRRMEEKEKLLDDEIDEIDAEFKALFSTDDVEETIVNIEQAGSPWYGGVGKFQFSAVEEEACSDLDYLEMSRDTARNH